MKSKPNAKRCQKEFVKIWVHYGKYYLSYEELRIILNRIRANDLHDRFESIARAKRGEK